MNHSATSYNVRIWKTDVYKGKTKTTYWVRWKVERKRFKRSFTTRALAESFRADLVSAARRGEAFRLDDGMPVSLARPVTEVDWYSFVVGYVDMKWPNAAATYRRTIAEALTAVTPVMFQDSKGKPEPGEIRSTLSRWSFNRQTREARQPSQNEASILRWMERNSLPVSAVLRPEVARAVHDAAVSKLNGKPLARSVARQRRMILNNALNHAVELNLIAENPVRAVKWVAPKPSRAIDRRRVANAFQARTILAAVPAVRHSGPRLAACYGAMYFAALRPEEAVNLREDWLDLPAPKWDDEKEEWVYHWGDVYVEEATPHAGKAWTDTGEARDRRGLKHREPGEGRHVPCPPELTRLLREHIERFGAAEDGRLFRGERGGDVPLITWNRVWRAARTRALTERAAASPLAKRPYDLRHAAVSLWLNGGVPPTQVAEWAGHSVDILLQVYAKCLDGQEQVARQQVQRALGYVDRSGPGG